MTPRSKARRAAASLLLVLVMLLSVITAATITTRTAIRQRAFEMEQASVRRLESAIAAVADSNVDASSPIRMPMDAEQDHWIEVQTIDSSSRMTKVLDSTDQSWLRATEIRGTRVLRRIDRSIEVAPPT